MQFSPKVVIQQAYDVASSSDVVQYVYATNTDFVFSHLQPPPTKSHWRILPSGELDARIMAHPKQVSHFYHRV